MSDLAFALVAERGALLLFAVTFLSCLALPVPASMMMLAGGAFVASGDLSAVAAVAAALAGAVVGDQTGFALGRAGGSALDRRIARRPARARLVERARQLTRRHGALGVFASRWLISPLGPYVNFVSGGLRLDWPRFTLWALAGEAVWVGLYLGLGYGFTSRIEEVATLLSNLTGLMVAVTMAAALALALRRLRRRGLRLPRRRRAPR